MEIIHIVLGKANPDRMNGVNKVVYQLATRQADAGKNVSVWGISPSTEHNYGDRNFKTRLYQAHRNPFRVSKALIADLKNRQGKAIIHLHGGWIPVFASLSKVLSILQIPFVLTPHGAYNTVAMKRSSWLKKVYFFLFEQQLLKRAARIHCIGESEVHGLQKIFKTEKTFLLPYGFEPAVTNVEKLTHNRKFIIGFVGRLDIHTKGLDLLIQAFAGVSYKFPHAMMWVIGDSKERSVLEEMIIESRLESKVIMWGSKFGNEKDDLIRQMDVFVHPSRNEGLPSAVLEAAAMGVPCIVTHATNVGQYIQQYDAGRAIENENPLELQQACEELCNLKESGKLDEMGKNGVKMVKEIFNWDLILNEFDKLYRFA
jgi:glycosyltransferase involved in cell wall biosynthesis